MLEAISMNKTALEITPELLEQNPGLAISISILSMLFIAMLLGSLASWGVIAIRMRRGQSLLAPEPWLPRAWGLVDLLMVAVFLFASQTFLGSIYLRLTGLQLEEGQPMPLGLTTTASFGNLLAIVLTLMWMALRYGVGPEHVGFRLGNWRRQLYIGVLGTLAALPIVYLIMAVVSSTLETEYKHPLLEEIKSSATLNSYVLGFITAVVLAPLGEEFLFRVLIQGWLQSIPFRKLFENLVGASGNRISTMTASQTVLSPIDPAPDVLQQPALLPPTTSLAPDLNRTEHSIAVLPVAASPEVFDANVQPPIWPSVVTGILFGLAHWGYGLSFVPLIVLGIVLGLFYRATNSIWPCVLMHCVLNGSSMLGLGILVLYERAIR